MADVNRILGEPDEVETDDDETELVYSPSDEVCFGVIFDQAGQLESIDFV